MSTLFYPDLPLSTRITMELSPPRDDGNDKNKDKDNDTEISKRPPTEVNDEKSNKPLTKRSRYAPSPGMPDTDPNGYPLKNIATPHVHDVLCGRGGGTNSHAGNNFYRDIVSEQKAAYITAPKKLKTSVSKNIVDIIRMRNPPGRFLARNEETGLWHDIGERKAIEKTAQALREGAPEMRQVIVKTPLMRNGMQGGTSDNMNHQQSGIFHPGSNGGQRGPNIVTTRMIDGKVIQEQRFQNQQPMHFMQPYTVSTSGNNGNNPVLPMVSSDVPVGMNQQPSQQRFIRQSQQRPAVYSNGPNHSRQNVSTRQPGGNHQITMSVPNHQPQQMNWNNQSQSNPSSRGGSYNDNQQNNHFNPEVKPPRNMIITNNTNVQNANLQNRRSGMPQLSAETKHGHSRDMNANDNINRPTHMNNRSMQITRAPPNESFRTNVNNRPSQRNTLSGPMDSSHSQKRPTSLPGIKAGSGGGGKPSDLSTSRITITLTGGDAPPHMLYVEHEGKDYEYVLARSPNNNPMPPQVVQSRNHPGNLAPPTHSSFASNELANMSQGPTVLQSCPSIAYVHPSGGGGEQIMSSSVPLSAHGNSRIYISNNNVGSSVGPPKLISTKSLTMDDPNENYRGSHPPMPSMQRSGQQYITANVPTQLRSGTSGNSVPTIYIENHPSQENSRVQMTTLPATGETTWGGMSDATLTVLNSQLSIGSFSGMPVNGGGGVSQYVHHAPSQAQGVEIRHISSQPGNGNTHR